MLGTCSTYDGVQLFARYRNYTRGLYGQELYQGNFSACMITRVQSLRKLVDTFDLGSWYKMVDAASIGVDGESIKQRQEELKEYWNQQKQNEQTIHHKSES